MLKTVKRFSRKSIKFILPSEREIKCLKLLHLTKVWNSIRSSLFRRKLCIIWETPENPLKSRSLSLFLSLLTFHSRDLRLSFRIFRKQSGSEREFFHWQNHQNKQSSDTTQLITDFPQLFSLALSPEKLSLSLSRFSHDVAIARLCCAAEFSLLNFPFSWSCVVLESRRETNLLRNRVFSRIFFFDDSGNWWKFQLKINERIER